MIWATLAIAIISLIVLIGAIGAKAKTAVALLTVINFASGIAFMVMAKPWWHWIWYDIFYMNPTVWIFFGIFLLIFIVVLAFGINRNMDEGTIGSIGGFLAICWVISIIVVSCINGVVTKSFIYDSISRQAITVTNLSDTTKIRYLPMEVAEYYGENRMQEPGIKLGDFDAIMYNGELTWVAPREQSGTIRQYTQKNDGVALINSNGSMTTVNVRMEYGENMLIFDDISWLLVNHNYWVDYPEIYYLFDGDTPVAVAPYISYKYKFPVMTPYWGGVCVVYPDGTLIDYTPSEAQAVPFLANERIFPEQLARLYAESYVYVHGIWNTITSHTDQIRIPALDYSDNQMPYLMPTEDGLQWVVVAEPASASYAIHSIFSIDAVTGELSVYRVPLDTNLLGPDRAWEYVKADFPSYDWVSSDNNNTNTGNIQLIEPRLVVNKGELYWMITITTKDYAFSSDKPSTVLVNSRTTEVTSFFSEQELVEFLYGSVGTDTDTDTNTDTGTGVDSGEGTPIEMPSDAKQLLTEIEDIRAEIGTLQAQMGQDQIHLEVLQAELNMKLEQLYDIISASSTAK